MPTLDQRRIEAVFSELGLGTEAERRRFRSLADPVPMSTEFYSPVRLDIESSPTTEEEEYAKLASTSGRNQGQG